MYIEHVIIVVSLSLIHTCTHTHIHTQDSYPGHTSSLRFGTSEDEHKPLLRVNNPEPSLSSIEVQARGLPKEVRKKKHVRFSDGDSSDKQQDRPVRGSLLPSKDYDVGWMYGDEREREHQQYMYVWYVVAEIM